MTFSDLFRPRWKNSDWGVRAEAVRNLTDPVLLVKLARTDSSETVRERAVESTD